MADDLKDIEELFEKLGKMIDNKGDIGKIMDECMQDACTIASSACTMAANRSYDLGMNPVVTIVVLKYLCQMNIDLQSKVMWEDMSKSHPNVPKEIHDAAFENMQKQVESMLKHAKYHTEEIKG